MADAVTAAARTGDWRQVVARADAEPDEVVAAVLSSGVRWNALPGEVAAVLSVAHQLRSADPHERGLLLELARVRHGVPPRGEESAGFRLRWADVPPRPTHVTVATGCDDWLTATVPLPDGRALLAYQAQRRALHLWDPATGTVTATIRGRGAVTAVAAEIGPDGVPRLAIASGRSVRVCDPRTGAVLDTWAAGVDRPVTAVCWLTLADGRPALATGDKDGAVLVWSPSGTQLAEVTRGPWNSGKVSAIVPWPQPDGGPLLAITWARTSTLSVVELSGAVFGDLDGVQATGTVPLGDRLLLATAWQQEISLWAPGERERFGEPFRLTDGYVSALAALPRPDGSTALAVADSGGLWLFDPRAPESSGSRLPTVDPRVWSMAALPLPGGRTVLATIDGGDALRLWDNDPAVPAATGAGPSLPQVALVELPDGRLLAATDDDGVRLRDADTGSPVGTPLLAAGEQTGALTAVRLADGRELVATGDQHGSVLLFDPVTGDRVAQTPPAHRGPVGALAAGVLPTGAPMLVSGDSQLLGWDPDGAPLGPTSATGYRERLSASAWLPLGDGRVALALGTSSWRGDGELHLLDPVSGKRLIAPIETGDVAALAAVPRADGGATLAVASRPDHVWCWHADGSDAPTLPAKGVRALTGFRHDGRSLVAAGGQDRTVQVFDAGTGSPVDCGPITARGKVTALATLPLADGRTLLAVAGGRTIVRWDPAAGGPVGKPLAGHTDVVQALAALPGPGGTGYLASAGADGTVRLWDAATGAPVGEPATGHAGPVRTLATVERADGRAMLASGGDDRAVWLWEPSADGLSGRRITGHQGGSDHLTAVPLADGRVVVGAAAGHYNPSGAWLWDPADRSDRPLGDGLCGPLAVVRLPDGRSLVAARHRDRLLQLYDPNTGRAAGRPLPVPFADAAELVAVSTPAGPRLAAGGNSGEIRLYDPVDGRAVGRLPGGDEDSRADLAVLRTDDGRCLVAAGDRHGVLRIWDPVDDRCLSTLSLDTRIWSLAARGSRLLIGCAGGYLALDVRPEPR
jgi:WD40 repeat protein